MGFFEERQPFLIEKKDEIESALECIASYFNINWLKKNGDHPLQILWQRKDTLAGSELYFFGVCLSEMAKVDLSWLKSNVNKIKIGSPNERIGFIFEVICLGMLSPFLKTKPAPLNRAGYDGIIELSDQKKIRLSIKSYGISRHYQDFLLSSRKIEETFRKAIKQVNIPASALLVDCDKFISSDEWLRISQEVYGLTTKFQGNVVSVERENVVVGITPLEEGGNFFPELNSYHVLLMGKYHNNEKKNLYDKLDDAYYNLNKHSGAEDDHYRNLVFIHLPPNASIHECSRWTYDYYAQFPNKQISGVFFYQPLVAREAATNYPFINHFVVGIMNGERFNEWNTERIPIQFNIPVGKFTNTIVVQRIRSIKSNAIESVEIPDRYIYQKGNYYFKGSKEGNSFTLDINLDNIASGIIAHGVVQFKPNTPFMVVTPRSHPSDDLLLL